MKNIKYVVSATALSAMLLTMSSCTGDMKDNGNISSGDNNSHISSAAGSIPDGDDIISSVEDFVSDFTSDVQDVVSDTVG